jgi:ubiquinone/menaquinone biosynthesis C-methylase UbiE
VNESEMLELLSPELMAEEDDLMQEIIRIKQDFGLDLGWHYPLDLIWILKNLRGLSPSIILDVGAGKGLLQFFLADLGHNVISLDIIRRRLPLAVKLSYKLQFSQYTDDGTLYTNHLKWRLPEDLPIFKSSVYFLLRVVYKLLRMCTSVISFAIGVLQTRWKHTGTIHFIRGDMADLKMLDDESIDAIVSVSSIEHLGSDLLPSAVKEMKRVIKKGGRILITTSAAEKDDYFHEPSIGWCYSERTIMNIFSLSIDCKSNWDEYREVMERIRNSSRLRELMSFSYRLSGRNGMPWGVWDPKYLPVGIKLKTNAD